MFVGKLSEWQKAWETAQEQGVVGNTVPKDNHPHLRFFNVYRTKGAFAGAVYRVTWWKGSVPFIQCTCQAGEHGIRCKHASFVLAELYPEHFPRSSRTEKPFDPEIRELGIKLLLGERRESH